MVLKKQKPQPLIREPGVEDVPDIPEPRDLEDLELEEDVPQMPQQPRRRPVPRRVINQQQANEIIQEEEGSEEEVDFNYFKRLSLEEQSELISNLQSLHDLKILSFQIKRAKGEYGVS